MVGCIIGFSIAAKGFDSINWDETKNIFISWVAAPLVTGAFAFCIFYAIRSFILKSANPFQRGYYTFPFILFATIGIDIFFMFNKGAKNFDHFQKEVYDNKWVIPTSFGIGAFFGVLWLWPVGPWAKKKLDARRIAREAAADDAAVNISPAKASMHTDDIGASENTREQQHKDNEQQDPEDGIIDTAEDVTAEKTTVAQVAPVGGKKTMQERFADATYNQNLEAQSFDESKRAKECWENSETYDVEVEQLFTFVQVFTASLSSFAHGANDIANAIAPVAAIVSIYETGVLDSKAPVPKWILGYGGVGLVLGLLLYGYKVMKTIGYKLTALSPSRGSSAELASSLMVVTASYMGIPVSCDEIMHILFFLCFASAHSFLFHWLNTIIPLIRFIKHNGLTGIHHTMHCWRCSRHWSCRRPPKCPVAAIG